MIDTKLYIQLAVKLRRKLMRKIKIKNIFNL